MKVKRVCLSYLGKSERQAALLDRRQFFLYGLLIGEVFDNVNQFIVVVELAIYPRKGYLTR